jgi:quinol monooxygenase YgiN
MQELTMSKRKSVRAAAVALALAASMPAEVNAADSQTPFIRIAELDIDPARLEAFKAAIAAGIEAAVSTEPKVLALYAVADKDNPARIRVFEIYTDAQAYEAHRQTAHFQKFFESTKSMVVSRRLIDTTPVALRSKPVELRSTK